MEAHEAMTVDARDLSSYKKYSQIQLFLKIVAEDRVFEVPIYIGDRRRERLQAILDYISQQQGMVGVSADQIKKFVMKELWASSKTASQDLRDLVFTNRLSRKGDLFFRTDGDE